MVIFPTFLRGDLTPEDARGGLCAPRDSRSMPRRGTGPSIKRESFPFHRFAHP